jgi:hypothetical protein
MPEGDNVPQACVTLVIKTKSNLLQACVTLVIKTKSNLPQACVILVIKTKSGYTCLKEIGFSFNN